MSDFSSNFQVLHWLAPSSWKQKRMASQLDLFSAEHPSKFPSASNMMDPPSMSSNCHIFPKGVSQIAWKKNVLSALCFSTFNFNFDFDRKRNQCEVVKCISSASCVYEIALASVVRPALTWLLILLHRSTDYLEIWQKHAFCDTKEVYFLF